jgi:hypothetical protein
MKNNTRELARVYQNNDWASVFSTLSGLLGVVIGLIIADFIGLI